MCNSTGKVMRQSNFELLRIVCMISIIMLHIWTQTDASGLRSGDGVSYFFFLLLGYGGRLVCNCFVMIGAWFLCDAQFKAERIVDLWLSVFFYAVGITIICALLRFPDVTLVRFVQAFLPIIGRPVWFPAEYILLLVLSPFLNRILWEEGSCRKIIIILEVLIMLPATLFPIEYTKPVFSELVWFCFLYLFTAYLKKHPRRWMDRKVVCTGGWLLMYVFCVSTYVILENLGLRNFSVYYMGHYETLFAFMTSLLLFMSFKNMKLGNIRVINFIGKNTFAVYLLHAMPCLALTLWNGIFAVDENLDHPLYIIGIIAIIFVVAMAVESIRKVLFSNFIYTGAIYKKICRKVDEFYKV